MRPILSVLIASVPSRREMAWALFDKISAQAGSEPSGAVEILLFLDNKKRSVGLKRQALVDIAAGQYIAFVDDDDDVADDYVSSILEARNSTSDTVDVITFDTLVRINDGPVVACQHELGFQDEQYSPGGFKRSPWQMHAWRKSLARRVRFPDKNNAEDAPWVSEMVKLARTQTKIDKALYFYRYDDAKTEASK